MSGTMMTIGGQEVAPPPQFVDPDERALRSQRTEAGQYASQYQEFVWQAISTAIRRGQSPNVAVREGTKQHAQTMFVVAGRQCGLCILPVGSSLKYVG